jgi:hypothetical protein
MEFDPFISDRSHKDLCIESLKVIDPIKSVKLSVTGTARLIIPFKAAILPMIKSLSFHLLYTPVMLTPHSGHVDPLAGRYFGKEI